MKLRNDLEGLAILSSHQIFPENFPSFFPDKDIDSKCAMSDSIRTCHDNLDLNLSGECLP